jgi:type I restriction-modification system DNA methylase subunit
LIHTSKNITKHDRVETHIRRKTVTRMANTTGRKQKKNKRTQTKQFCMGSVNNISNTNTLHRIVGIKERRSAGQDRRTTLMIKVRRLNVMRNKTRPCNECLFIDNENEFMEKSSAKTIATLISSHRRAIINSVKKWVKLSHTGVATISQWASNNNSTGTIERINSIRRNRLINNGRNKERRRRSRS